MNETLRFTPEEREELFGIKSRLKTDVASSLHQGDVVKIKKHIAHALKTECLSRNFFGHNPILSGFESAEIIVGEIGAMRECIIASLLFCIKQDDERLSELRADFGEGVADIIASLWKIESLSGKSATAGRENFGNLLLSFAGDIRAVLIIIASQVNIMRKLSACSDSEEKRAVADEASTVYAPLAHKLGLYRLKSELEDLGMKYLERQPYYMIKEKLNATKRARDAYMEAFIQPIEKKLTDAGIKCHVKGRTKSIHSIWQKMKRQRCAFEGIYDLFAIRVIIDSPVEKEKMLCWQAYSIVTDMYQPNPRRLRDWLSVPKANGYESLHTTVLGPSNKWVEVQIRTERMDETAERGLAAHWKYKGVKGDAMSDKWLADIRTALEAGTTVRVGRKVDMGEIYVFTPKGQLLRLPSGATVLDFAYHIHSDIGNKCSGARINGKNAPIRQVLHSGDQVEVITQAGQTPKRDWMNIVTTNRAKAKLRLSLRETQIKDGLLAKEMLARKLKNRKIELDEATVSHLLKKLGIKETSDFYKQLADEKLDIGDVIEKYIEVREHDNNPSTGVSSVRSAGEYVYESDETATTGHEDVLVIDDNIRGMEYSLAKCCRPIYGDNVFGFITVGGGIKIHCQSCPNAPELRRRFPHRIVKAVWSGKGTSKYNISLLIVGNDDMGVVNNVTSLISKEEGASIRSINIESHDGLFSGTLTVIVEDTSRLEALLRKLRTVKGIKTVRRL